jgi:hypothetical protein
MSLPTSISPLRLAEHASSSARESMCAPAVVPAAPPQSPRARELRAQEPPETSTRDEGHAPLHAAEPTPVQFAAIRCHPATSRATKRAAKPRTGV